MRKTNTLIKDSIEVHQKIRKFKVFSKLGPFALMLALMASGCKKDDYKGAVQGVCPIVVSTDPMDKAVDVVPGKVISVTFNTAMKPSAINSSTFTITQGSTVIAGAVSATANTAVFNFTPAVALSPFTTYTGTITTGAKDTFGTSPISNYVWTFVTMPQVSLSPNVVAGGTVTGAGAVAQGSIITVTATANPGYAFTNWTNNGVVVSTSASYQFTVAGNVGLVANFIPVTAGKFAVNLSSAPLPGGTTSGSGVYNAGSTVTVTAFPNNGYTFTNWTNNGVIASVSSSFQFIVTGNTTLVANYKTIPSSQLAVILSSNPAAGGTTTGSGSFNTGSSVTVNAIPNAGYSFVNWTNKGVIASTSANYTFPLTVNTTLVANFAINTFTLNVTAVNGSVAKNPNQTTYNYLTSVQLTATASPGYSFTSWSGDASGSTNPLTISMNANKNITANFTLNPAIGPGDINLGAAASFVTLTQSGISTTGVTSIVGDIGVSPAASTAITGFGLIVNSNGQSAHTPIVTGNVFAADYATPTPANLTTAVNDMQTAFTTANGLVTPAPVVDLGAGDISGLILPPGLYKWSTGVLITNAGVTLTGGPNDTWVFQIAQNLTVNNSANITLLGGAQAKNIFWVVTGQATLGTNVNFSGNILSKTLISVNTGTTVTGRLLAQTAVTLNADMVTFP
jgi:uncharacterized repeat protein (TIGR02543 family)